MSDNRNLRDILSEYLGNVEQDSNLNRISLLLMDLQERDITCSGLRNYEKNIIDQDPKWSQLNGILFKLSIERYLQAYLLESESCCIENCNNRPIFYHYFDCFCKTHRPKQTFKGDLIYPPEYKVNIENL